MGISLISTLKAKAFGAIEKKATIGVGVPSYTSGAQPWKGKADILNIIPTKRKSMETINKLESVYLDER